jgi:hypothetical protein
MDRIVTNIIKKYKNFRLPLENDLSNVGPLTLKPKTLKLVASVKNHDYYSPLDKGWGRGN